MSELPVPTSARAVGWFWLAVVVAAIAAWQFFSLNSVAARAAFDPLPHKEAAGE